MNAVTFTVGRIRVLKDVLRARLGLPGGGNGMETKGEVRKATGPLAGPRRVGLWVAELQAQVSDFRMAPRCMAAPLVTKA